MVVGWSFIRLLIRKSVCNTHKSFNFRICLMRDVIDHFGGKNCGITHKLNQR